MLLDTHVLLALLWERLDMLEHRLRQAIITPAGILHASVASLWEIAIKFRLGKLQLEMPVEHLPEVVRGLGLELLPITASHVVAQANPLPPTRDPFDRLLLAQCLVEDLRLLTTDRALAQHPLAWRAD